MSFDLLDRVRITDGSHKGREGYVTGERVEGGVRLYEVTCGAPAHGCGAGGGGANGEQLYPPETPCGALR